MDNNLIVALDIGTSKVVAIVAEATPEGELEVIGVGTNPSRGLKKGVVVNIDATVQSVQAAIEEAELMSGCQVHSVFTGISGSHIKSKNSHGFVAVKTGEIGEEDIARVIEAAKAITIPADHKILHVLPQEFKVDLQEGIVDPTGMSGVRLEGKVHIITGAIGAAQNIVNCVRRCGLEVEDITLQQIASSRAVLTEDEKNLGVCLIDIGGGTTDIAVFTDGAIRHTAVLPVAGDQVTNDLAIALRISHQEAESIKIENGCAYKKIATPEQAPLAEIMEPRFEELFALILAELQKQGWDGLLGAGVVLTGGSAKTPGVVELAESIFQTHARIGYPRYVTGMSEVIENPIYATGIGLLLQGQQTMTVAPRKVSIQQGIGNVISKVKHWFKGNFSNNWCRPCTCATTHTSCNEYHIRTF